MALAWTEAEDKTLSQKVSQLGLKQWTLIAKHMNLQFHNDLPVRSAKHCRERWNNHVNPELNSKV